MDLRNVIYELAKPSIESFWIFPKHGMSNAVRLVDFGMGMNRRDLRRRRRKHDAVFGAVRDQERDI